MAMGGFVHPRDGCFLLSHKETSSESSLSPLPSKPWVKTGSFHAGGILSLELSRSWSPRDHERCCPRANTRHVADARALWLATCLACAQHALCVPWR